MYPEIQSLNAELFALSMDDIYDTTTLSLALDLDYSVLSDPDAYVAKKYGVFNLLGDGVATPSVFIRAIYCLRIEQSGSSNILTKSFKALGNALGDSLGTPWGDLGNALRSLGEALGSLGSALEGLGNALGGFGDALRGPWERLGRPFLEDLPWKTLGKPGKTSQNPRSRETPANTSEDS